MFCLFTHPLLYITIHSECLSVHMMTLHQHWSFFSALVCSTVTSTLWALLKLCGDCVKSVWTSLITGLCWATAWSEPTYQTPSSHREALTASPQGFLWRWWASVKAAWSWTRWCTSCREPAPTRSCLTSLNASPTCSGWMEATREAARPGWRTSRCWRSSPPAACRSTPTWPRTRCATRCGPGWAASTGTSSRPWRSSEPVPARSCTSRTSPRPSRTTSGSSRSSESEPIAWTSLSAADCVSRVQSECLNRWSYLIVLTKRSTDDDRWLLLLNALDRLLWPRGGTRRYENGLPPYLFSRLNITFYLWFCLRVAAELLKHDWLVLPQSEGTTLMSVTWRKV